MSQNQSQAQVTENLYVCTSSGTKNGIPYATMTRVIHGQKKNSSDTYAFLDSQSTIQEQEEIKLGTILAYQTTRAEQPIK